MTPKAPDCCCRRLIRPDARGLRLRRRLRLRRQPLLLARARNNEVPPGADRPGHTGRTRAAKFLCHQQPPSPHNDKVRTYLRDLEARIDRLQARRAHRSRPRPHHDGQKSGPRPGAPLRAGNTTNWATVRVLAKAGVQMRASSCRARASVDEIEKIRQGADMEIRVFELHGALCIALLRAASPAQRLLQPPRWPNQGTCTNACRWEYRTHDAAVDPNTGGPWPPAGMDKGPASTRRAGGRRPVRQHLRQRRAPPTDQVYLIEEIGRPGG